jgi:hypothetical protein
MSEKFEEITPDSQLKQQPDLIIKYFENALVFIANDAERPTQKIAFSDEDKLTITIIILMLMCDLATSRKNETNRANFIWDLIYDLARYIPSI